MEQTSMCQSDAPEGPTYVSWECEVCSGHYLTVAGWQAAWTLRTVGFPHCPYCGQGTGWWQKQESNDWVAHRPLN